MTDYSSSDVAGLAQPADWSELFKSSKETPTPVEGKITGKDPRIITTCYMVYNYNEHVFFLEGKKDFPPARYFSSPDWSELFKSSKETPTPIEGRITGSIPEWVSGVFLRNGGGQFEVGDYSVNHLFDGFALLHKFVINNGKVTYSSRFLRGDAYIKATEQQRIVYPGIATLNVPDPCQNIFRRYLSYFNPIGKPSDNCNVNYMQVGENFYALTETTKVIKVDVSELKTEEKFDVADYMAVNTSSAHPHYDKDGTVYNMGSSYGANAAYNIIKIPPGDTEDPFQRASILCKIPAASSMKPSYYHSFGMTENYIVFIEQPFRLNLPKVMISRFLKRELAQCIEYNPHEHARFYVIRREDGAILPRVYKADAFFCFHHINAYEDGGHLAVDVCCYDDEKTMVRSYLKNLRNNEVPAENSKAKRFVLPLEDKISDESSTGEPANLVSLPGSDAEAYRNADGSIHCIPEILCGMSIELPRINYDSHNGERYRYFYGVSGTATESIMKVDTVNKTFRLWSEPSCYPAEPVFVPRPGATDEDDGVVLSSFVDLNDGALPFLVVLDGKTFTEVARAEIPADIPLGIHGIFIPKI